jgi:hypothetical protein
MKLITNRISTGEANRFEDFIKKFKEEKQVKVASTDETVKTAEEKDEADSSGQLAVEPLHQTGESTTMPKNGPSAKKDDGKASASKTAKETDEADSSGQPEAEGKLVNDPKVPSKEEKGGSEETEVKEAGKTERGKRDGTGPFEGSAQKEKSDVGKRKQRGEECPCKEDDKDKEEIKEAGVKGVCEKCSKPNFLCKCDKGDEEKGDEENKEEDKEEEKEASQEVQFVKIANLDAKNKTFLKEYWRQIYGDDYADALVADK